MMVPLTFVIDALKGYTYTSPAYLCLIKYQKVTFIKRLSLSGITALYYYIICPI